MFESFFRKNNQFSASRKFSLTILIELTFLYAFHFQLSKNYKNRCNNQKCKKTAHQLRKTYFYKLI